MARDYCVYTPAKWGEFAGDFVSPVRSFDLVVNDWTGDGRFSAAGQKADYKFAEKGHKWPTIATILPRLPNYRFYAFVDEDIDVSAETLNALFQVGEALKLDLYQPALTRRSHGNHEFLFQNPDSYVRATRFVEIMAPFLSYDALQKVRPTFTISELGWGLEYVWNDILKSEGMAIVDRYPITHIRPVQSGKWKNQRGESPEQECARVLDEWKNRNS